MEGGGTPPNGMGWDDDSIFTRPQMVESGSQTVLLTYSSGFVSSEEKHSLDVTVTLTVRADESKLPLLFVERGLPGAMVPFKRFLRVEWLAEEIIDGEDGDEFDSPCAAQKRLAMINRLIRAWEKVSEDVIRESFAKAIPSA
ncbi:hypothetical protein B5M09_013367 [Aphanomyces astaci]|uniref:DDE-1 domain-containing protein n=1 Tax=Aphanomyces astaci TaxID=112090 RepID=A0A3R7W1X8_APHAT|nr:hypothetical protein B5M09_013367 [Aphanomyces astaci]